jgi:hypothetical protein
MENAMVYSSWLHPETFVRVSLWAFCSMSKTTWAANSKELSVTGNS